jgi:GNAT superfamily N-acetyltransferase
MSIPWYLDLPRFGDPGRVSDWVEKQLALCDDDAFARSFAASCPVSGLGSDAYRHRKLEVEGQKILVGIRFKGGDVTQPFVDMLAWTGEPCPGWIVALKEAFAPFAPRAVRFRWSKETNPPWPGDVDQYVFAGPSAGLSHASVAPALDLSWFDEFSRAFDEWRRTSPLGPEVWPSDLDELKECLEDGHIVVATDGDKFQGLAACLWRTERAFEGWSIMEEFVVPEAQGRGLGTALQRGLMHCLPPGDLVWGTIHGNNAASQATAARCGRKPVETWWFAPLGVP